MGRVFEAQRSDGHYQQRAAIKVLLGYSGPEALERLKRERQILANLEHPNIARLLDGGTTPAGRPYLVMEFADGEPIDRHAAAHGLDLAARLRLFDQVCEALAYAHRSLVIHCDIKPSNVLVDKDGRVRLIDFGISRLEGEGEDTAPAMTLAYASPEQKAGQAPGVASDIYSLGRLLQELVAPTHTEAHRPHPNPPPQAGEGATLAAALTPSPATATAVTPSPAKRGRAGVGAWVLNRGKTSNPSQPHARVPDKLPPNRELAAIIAKATAVEAAARYDSVGALQRDLQRLRAHQPVQALPQTATYVAAKFLRRRWPWVAAGAAALFMAAGFTVRVVQERNEAQFQRQQAEGLIEFMLDDLRKKLEPVGRLDALDAVGQKALAHHGEAAEANLDAAALGRRARSLHLVGEIAQLRGKRDEAAVAFARAAATTERLLALAPDNPQRLYEHAQSVFWVGYLDFDAGRFDAAEPALRRYAELARALVARQPDKQEWQKEVAYGARNLAMLEVKRGRPERALPYLEQARAAWAALAVVHPENVFDLAENLAAIAKVNQDLSRPAEALASVQSVEELLLPRVKRDRDVKPARDLQYVYRVAAQVSLNIGELARAQAYAERAVSMGLRAQQADPDNQFVSSELAFSRVLLSESEFFSGHDDRARATLRDAEDGLDRSAGERLGNHQELVTLHARALRQRAVLALRLGAGASGEAAAVQRFLDSLPVGPSDDRERLRELGWLRFELARLLAAAGRVDQAQQQLTALAKELLQAAVAPDWNLLTLRARALAVSGQQEEAQVLARQLASTGFRHPVYADLQRELAGGAMPAAQPKGVSR
jgi:serine/threonine-protein kinase